MGTYKKVRAIERGFDVLVALNSGGAASVASLSERTGIHRTTVYRVLDTLEALGYVRRSVVDEIYHVTSRVRALSAGFDDSEIIASAASPTLASLLGEVAWPSSVATPGDDAMIIRETTHGRGDLFVHDVTVGTRSPILTTAMGRAYLAWCDDAERQEILDRLARSNTSEAVLARNWRYVDQVIATTRAQGYGSSFGDAEANLGSVAMPIRSHDRVMGCINVVFFTSAVPRRSAETKFVPALTRAVSAIQRNLDPH